MFAGKNDRQIPSSINSETFYMKAKRADKDVTFHLFENEGYTIEPRNNKDFLWEEIFKFLEL